MSEADIIARTDAAFGGPVTRDRIAADLRKLGLLKGDVVLVHCSLSALGWVNGGAETLIRAILDVLGKSGTLVMPAHSGALSDPGLWENPPVPPNWVETVRATMPPFDPEVTPTRGLGVTAELFRSFPRVLRSSHPMDSFCALGPAARRITASQNISDGLGEGGPLAHLYRLKARILLIGCGYDKNTSLHLSEIRADWPGKKRIRQGSPVLEGGRRVWKWFEEVELETDDFASCGTAFEDSDGEEVYIGRIGLAESHLMPLRALVDFGTAWFSAHRGHEKGEHPA
jgi:aminoglycoside 3-N-acetyltransferase